MRIMKDGPELVLSTMIVGKARTLFGSNISIELDHFRDYGNVVPENAVAVHGTITPSVNYLLRLTRDQRATPIGTTMRAIFFAQMHPIEATIKMLNRRSTTTDLVAHPETGAYILKALRAKKVSLENIRLLIENEEDDGGGGYDFARMFPGVLPQQPKGVKLLANALSEFGDVRCLLDVDHFWNNFPDGSIVQAAQEMGEIDTVHISGARHVGTAPEKILEIADALHPKRITLEGKIPPHVDSVRGKVSPQHIEQLKEHVYRLTTEDLLLHT